MRNALLARDAADEDGRRTLGVDLDSVCGRRGVCSKCQVSPSFGAHAKHGITVTEDALSGVNAVEERYDRVRGLKEGRRLGCQACIQGDVVIDVPPESQVHKQVVRKRAEAREIVGWAERVQLGLDGEVLDGELGLVGLAHDLRSLWLGHVRLQLLDLLLRHGLQLHPLQRDLVSGEDFLLQQRGQKLFV